MLPTQLQPETTYLYTGIDEIKVIYKGKTTKGNYSFIAAEGRYKGVKRSLTETSVHNLIQPIS